MLRIEELNVIGVGEKVQGYVIELSQDTGEFKVVNYFINEHGEYVSEEIGTFKAVQDEWKNYFDVFKEAMSKFGQPDKMYIDLQVYDFIMDVIKFELQQEG